MDKLDEIMEWKRKEIAQKVRPVSERNLVNLESGFREEHLFMMPWLNKMNYR